jgi:hypothetical protein
MLTRRKLEYPQKTSDLPQVTDKLYHIMLLNHNGGAVVNLLAFSAIDLRFKQH